MHETVLKLMQRWEIAHFVYCGKLIHIKDLEERPFLKVFLCPNHSANVQVANCLIYRRSVVICIVISNDLPKEGLRYEPFCHCTFGIFQCMAGEKCPLVQRQKWRRVSDRAIWERQSWLINNQRKIRLYLALETIFYIDDYIGKCYDILIR